MKKFILLVLFSSFVFGADLSWSPNFTTAKVQAQKEDKLILLIYTMVDCPACEYLKDVTLDDENVRQYLHQNFVLVERDAKNPSQKITNFDVFGTPTIYFLNKFGEKVTPSMVGAATAMKFLDKLKEVKKISIK